MPRDQGSTLLLGLGLTEIGLDKVFLDNGCQQQLNNNYLIIY